MSINPYQSPTTLDNRTSDGPTAARPDGVHEYLLSANNADGKKVTERVEASSADAAVKTLEARGYSGIVLHTDDFGALFTTQSKGEPVVTPKDFVDFRNLQGYWRRVGFLTRKLYAQVWKWDVLLVLMLLTSRWMHWRWGIMDYLVIGFLIAPLGVAMITLLNNPALRYHKFMELVAWGRWAEVLEQASRLRGRLPEQELLWNRAKALAGLGQLSNALELVAPLAKDPKLPQWLYFSRLGELYAMAGQRDEHLAWNQKALDLAPDNATLLIDHAMSLLRFQVDLPGARQLLVRARSHALSDALSPAADAVEGVLLFEEGNPNQAQDKLSAGLAGLDRFRHLSPLIGAVQDRFRAYRALSLAALGELPAAEREFQLAEPRLRALKRFELLARWQEVMSTTPAPIQPPTSESPAATSPSVTSATPTSATPTPPAPTSPTSSEESSGTAEEPKCETPAIVADAAES